MVERIVLENGVRLLLEPVPTVRSASVGITVATGSRYENAANNGVSHFIEHMLFKGSATMSAAQLAQKMDEIGGNYNAFTSREYTNFYFRALDRDLTAGIRVMGDMLLNPRLAESDIDLERGVICEELDMSEDTPDELVYDLLFAAAYPDSPVGYSIVGSRDTLAALHSAELRAYMAANYVGSAVVVAMTGSYSDEAAELLKSTFSRLKAAPAPVFEPAVFASGEVFREKKIEQNHLCLGFNAISYNDPRRHALSVFTSILGSGMSSRLFRRVREESGLCYNISASYIPMPDAGICTIYVATNPSTQNKALALIREETERLMTDGPTEEELSRTRKLISSGILMSLESTYARMSSNTRSELQFGRVISPEESVAAYEAVTAEDVCAIARECFDFDRMTKAIVGTKI